MKKLPAPALPRWLDAQLPFERYRVQVGALAMHVMEQGEGLPVLLLHGNPAWGYLWRKVAQRLRGERLRLVMPDLVGLGYSERPGARWHTLEAHAQAIAELLRVLRIERLVFVAHDWGGPIGGTAIASIGAERLVGAVVLNTGLSPPKPGSRGSAFHRFARRPVISDVAFRLLGFPQRALHRVQADPSSIRGEVARAYRVPLRNPLRNAAPLAMARMVPLGPGEPSVRGLERCQRLFESFRGPAEIVWGDADPVLGRALGRVQALLPQAAVTHVRAGHFLQEEAPDEVAQAIARVARRAATLP